MVEKTKSYGVDALAKELAVKAATTRALLREHKIPRKEKAYGWDSVAELKAVAKKIKSVSAKGPKKTAARKVKKAA